MGTGNDNPIIKAELELGLGPVALAEAMHVPYDTYKDLKSGRRELKGIHLRVLDLLLAVHGTRKGRRFGV